MRKSLIIAFVLCVSLAASAQNSLSLPTGTALKMKLQTPLSTSTSKVGESFTGRITEPVLFEGRTMIPIGATVQGRVTKLTEPRRIAGKPTIGIYPESLVLPNGERFLLSATLVDTNRRGGSDVNEEGQFKGPGHDGSDLAELGVGTGTGLALGALIDGGKGALVGGAVGATLTVGHWLSKHRNAYLPAGSEMVMELSRPLQMTSVNAGN
jgi:hypothetical protein